MIAAMPLLLALAAVAAAPQPGALQLFRDWTVGCDNGRACQAVALMPESAFDRASTLVLTRGPAADAAPDARVVAPDGAPVAAEAGGRRFRLDPTPEGAAFRAEDMPALIAVLRRAAQLRLFDAFGKELGPVSLNGATAALLYMDAEQQRVDTVTALVRTGSKPAAAVPTPPPLPVIRAAPASTRKLPRVDRAKALATVTDGDCGERFEPGDVGLFRLDDEDTLVLVPDRCNSGAYNIGHVVMIADNRGRLRPAPFDAWPGWAEGDNLAINAAWDVAARRLTSYAKGRGLGDCGMLQDYVWDGARFRRVEVAQMRECRGSGDWITIFRAEVR